MANPFSALREIKQLRAERVAEQLQFTLLGRQLMQSADRVTRLKQELAVEKSVNMSLQLENEKLQQALSDATTAKKPAESIQPTLPTEIEDVITYEWAGNPIAASMTRQMARAMVRNGMDTEAIKRTVRGNVIDVE